VTGKAERPLLSSSKVASMLGVSPSTILRAVRRGRLQAAGVTPAGYARLRFEETRQALRGTESLTPRLLTSTEVADQLGVSRSTMARAVRAGKVRPAVVTPGGHYRFTPMSVTAIAAGLGISATPPSRPVPAPAPPAATTTAGGPQPLPAGAIPSNLRRPALRPDFTLRLLISAAAAAAQIPIVALARAAVAAIRNSEVSGL